MGLNYVSKNILIILTLSTTLFFIGCGEAEEVLQEESQPTANVSVQPTVEEEQDPMEQALTNFTGSDFEPKVAKQQTQQVESIKPEQVTLYEKQLEESRKENTLLKQNIVRLEQENRIISTRMAEVEAKYNAELQKTPVVTANPVVVPAIEAPVEEKQVVVEVEKESISYDDAMQYFKSKKYSEAIKGFKELSVSGNKEVAGRAKYWLGESYFASKKYNDALKAFQEVIKLKSSEKKADAQFMIGRAYEALGKKASAKAAYEKVVKNYPMSKNVKAAKSRWAKL